MGPQWWIQVLLIIFPLVQTSNAGENFHYRHFYSQTSTIDLYAMICFNTITTATAIFHFHTNHTSISRECVEINLKIIVLYGALAQFLQSSLSSLQIQRNDNSIFHR